MSQTDIIKLEKINFLERHSEKFYNELFHKDENNCSTITLITSMLLNQNKLEECEEYNILLERIEINKEEKLGNNFTGDILSTITQFLTRLGAEDSVGVILSYSKFNCKKENAKAKVLYIA